MTDNLPEIKRLIDDLVDSIDFTRKGAEAALGEALLDIVVDGVSNRSAEAVDPDGTPWPENRGAYGAAKSTRGIPVGVGYYGLMTAARDPRTTAPTDELGGEMLSLQQLQGRRTIQPETAVMVYGTDDEVSRKGQWFTNGSDESDVGERSGADNQPPRPFYAIAQDDLDLVSETLDEFVGDILGGL